MVCPNRLSFLILGVSVKCHSLNLSPVLAYGFGGGVLQSFWVFLLTEKLKEVGCQLRSKAEEKVS